MRDRFALVLGAALLGLLAQACTASIDVDKKELKTRPVGCLKGASLSCPCPDGSTSSQVCNELGRFDPCQCDAAGAAGTGN